MAAEGDNIVRFTYTGADGEVIPRGATHVIVKARKVREEAFFRHRNIIEVIFDDRVEKIEASAFEECPSLRRVIMRGVLIVERCAFMSCHALEEMECNKLEIIGERAFSWLGVYLRSLNLPSVRIVHRRALSDCHGLNNVKFGSNLERIEGAAFDGCYNLDGIVIPLKDGLITRDNIFTGCRRLDRVDLVEGELHETIAALHLVKWRNDMREEIDSIQEILPDTPTGGEQRGDEGEIAQEIRRWIRSVLEKITRYQAKHRRLLDEDVATILQCELPVAFSQDIVMNNVHSFLELPPYTFEVEDDLRLWEE